MLKFPSLICSASLILATELLAKGEEGTIQRPEPVANSASIFISDSLDVPEFSPPDSGLKKKVPEMRVDSALTTPMGNSRNLTILRGEASTLPDLPVPEEPIAQEKKPLTPDQINKLAEHRQHSLQMGATVIDHRISVVRWHHSVSAESYEAVCGFDIGLLAGIGQFVHHGDGYTLSLMHSHHATDNPRDLVAKQFSDLPEIEENTIIFTKGNANDLVGIAPITLVKELIASEKARLTEFQNRRKDHEQASTAWAKANPPVPQHETIWLRPHRGSRYLADPRPEAVAR